MSVLVYRQQADPPRELPVLSNRAIGWAATALIVLGAGVAVALLVAFGDGGHSGRLEAIKTAGTIVLGTGGAAALWLTARRQRTSELSLNQAHAAHATTIADAEARRITDLYGKAADQLGAAQAPVRLAGLYALERLAQDNPAQRQTIVDLLCAYLRMPYQRPQREPARRPGVSRPLLGSHARQRASVRLAPPAARADALTAEYAEAEQERQVRRTAQTILFRHLKFGTKDEPVDTFWPDINLDLTGAVLGPANLIGCRIVAADFTDATFTGDVWFNDVRFRLNAVFTGARFTGVAQFANTRFDHEADFRRATFDKAARFADVDFRGNTTFKQADFRSEAVFTGATFAADAWFAEADFGGEVNFGKARFAGLGVFAHTRFAANAYFAHTHFDIGADFSEARFAGAFTGFVAANLGSVRFHATEFGGNTEFTGALFAEDTTFTMARFDAGVEFTRARFHGTAHFGGARFTKPAVFEEAVFVGDTRFYDCRFDGLTTFERARFQANVWFESAEFADGVGFTKTVFRGEVKFLNTRFGDVCGFFHARFEDDVVFSWIRFGGPVSFTGTEFARPPRINTVWVRADVRKIGSGSVWPPGTEVRDVCERPYVASEGEWGTLVLARPDDPAGSHVPPENSTR